MTRRQLWHTIQRKMSPMRYPEVLAAVSAVAAFALAGCGAQATTTPPTSITRPTSAPAPQQAGNEPGGFGTSDTIANPVPVLRLTGVPVPASEVNGTIGLDADRGASASFPGLYGETIWVFTYPSAAYRDYRLAHPLTPPSDGDTGISGPGASIIIVDTMNGTMTSGPSPAVIAARVHGTVVVPAS